MLATREFEFIGGALCLDFANTVGGLRYTAHAREYLLGYEHLVVWSQQAGLLPAEEAEQLIRESTRRSAESTIVFERAIALREAIYRVCTALYESSEPTVTDLHILDAELVLAQPHLHLTWAHGAIEWEWARQEGALDTMLWFIVRSAAELLTGSESRVLGQCSSDTCGWLFIDTTKNHSRRWCDMGGCGNREKVRRHRAHQPKQTQTHP